MVQQLNIKGIFINSRFKQLVLLICIANAIIIYFLLTRIDLVVHGDLYSFGLVYNSEWADSYRLFMCSIYACLVIPVVLSGLVLGFSLLDKPNLTQMQRKVTVTPSKLPGKTVKDAENTPILPDKPLKTQKKLQANLPEKNISSEPRKEVKSPPITEGEMEPGEHNQQSNSMIISCPKCKKVFSRPLVMLDFGGGKAKLVNVCPYCNQTLGTTDEEQDNCSMGLIDEHKRIELK